MNRKCVLNSYKIIDREETDKNITLCVIPVKNHTSCKYCGHTAIRKYRVQSQPYHDTPKDCKPVVLLIDVQRYLCKKCGKTFLEALPGIHRIHNMSTRLIDLILREGKHQAPSILAKTIGCGSDEIARIFTEEKTPLIHAER